MSILDLQLNQHPPEVAVLKERMQEIVNALLGQTPLLPTALVDIHKNLLLHEELVHLLDDDDIMHLHKAHEIHKQYVLVQKEAKKSSKSKKVTENDLANL